MAEALKTGPTNEILKDQSEELRKLIEESENARKPKHWPLEHFDLYTLTTESKAKALQYLQSKLQKEKMKRQSEIRLKDYDEKLDDVNNKEVRRLNKAIKKIEASKDMRNAKHDTNSGTKEPEYIKKFRFYVDKIIAKKQSVN